MRKRSRMGSEQRKRRMGRKKDKQEKKKEKNTHKPAAKLHANYFPHTNSFSHQQPAKQHLSFSTPSSLAAKSKWSFQSQNAIHRVRWKKKWKPETHHHWKKKKKTLSFITKNVNISWLYGFKMNNEQSVLKIRNHSFHYYLILEGNSTNWFHYLDLQTLQVDERYLGSQPPLTSMKALDKKTSNCSDVICVAVFGSGHLRYT